MKEMIPAQRISFKKVILPILIALALLPLFFSSNGNGKSGGSHAFWAESDGAEVPKVFSPKIFVNIGKKVDAAVVNISTVQTVKKAPNTSSPHFQHPGGGSPFDNFFKDFFDRFSPREGFKRRSLGSGFIINQEGFIITNNHVVAQADEITVTLADKQTFEAEIVGRDPKTDLALIRVKNKKTSSKFKPVALGNSDAIEVGDMVVAIGNPFGLDHTLTTGVISAKERNINMGNYDDFLQTDASINPGNSGGPLLNLNGEVIGINTAINAAGQGIGFAIPINMAKQIIVQLKNKGKVVRGWLGVFISSMDQDLAKFLKMDKPTGAVVNKVQDNSPAEKAGIQREDVILEFNGKIIETHDDLPILVANTVPGTKVKLKILRKGKTIEKRVVIGELKDPEIAQTEPGEKKNKLGLEVQELTPDLARSLGLEGDEQGVVVTDVTPTSPVYDKGLRRGQLIIEINQTKIRSLKDFEKATAGLKKGDSVLIWAKSRQGTFYVALTL